MAWHSAVTLLVAALAVLLPSPAPAAPGASAPGATTLDGLRVRDDGAVTRVEAEIEGSVAPQIGILSDHRLVVDLPGVVSRLRESEIPGKGDRLRRVRIGKHLVPAPKTRLVLDLTGPEEYVLQPTPSGFTIAIGESVASLPPPGPDPVVAEAAHAEAPRKAPEAAPAADLALAETEPVADAMAPARPAPGGLVSIDFQEADVRSVIDLVAAVGGYDVVFEPEVQGKVTVKIVDRPWEEALGTILRQQHLRAEHEDDWIAISPAQAPAGSTETATP